MSTEDRAQIIEIWKTVVEVQRHFNEISMRIRGLFVTILLALFASIGFLLDKGLNLQFSVIKIQFAVLVPLFGIFGAYLFYFIDRYWYHRLLIGAVKHGIIIEAKYKSDIPELSLSDAIGAESPYKPTGPVALLAKLLVRHDRYKTTGKLHSDGKIELFYKSVMLALLVTAIMLGLLGGVEVSQTDRGPLPSATSPSVVPGRNSTPLKESSGADENPNPAQDDAAAANQESDE